MSNSQRIQAVQNALAKRQSGGFQNASGNYVNAGGPVGTPGPYQRNWNAAAGVNVQNNGMPTSPPFILRVSNASIGDVSNVDLFLANKYLGSSYSSNWSNGSLTINSVTISSNIANTTYEEFLQQTKDNPFIISQSKLSYSSGSSSSAQLTTPITWGYQDASGATQGFPLIFDFNITQNITTQTVNLQSYGINGKTYLRIPTVYASSVFLVYLYPSTVLDPSNALGGMNVQQQFANPMNNVQKVYQV